MFLETKTWQWSLIVGTIAVVPPRVVAIAYAHTMATPNEVLNTLQSPSCSAYASATRWPHASTYVAHCLMLLLPRALLQLLVLSSIMTTVRAAIRSGRLCGGHDWDLHRCRRRCVPDSWPAPGVLHADACARLLSAGSGKVQADTETDVRGRCARQMCGRFSKVARVPVSAGTAMVSAEVPS